MQTPLQSQILLTPDLQPISSRLFVWALRFFWASQNYKVPCEYEYGYEIFVAILNTKFKPFTGELIYNHTWACAHCIDPCSWQTFLIHISW